MNLDYWDEMTCYRPRRVNKTVFIIHQKTTT